MQEPGTSDVRFDINYFDGVNNAVTSRLAKREEMAHAENVRAPVIGALEKREGQTSVGNDISATAHYGLFRLTNTNSSYTDKYRICKVGGATGIYVLTTGGSWELLSDADAQGLSDGVFDYAYVDGKVILVNRANNNLMIDEDGVTVTTSSDSGSLYNSPKAGKVAFYKNRIYLADIVKGSTRFKTTVQRSSYPLGIIALVNGDYNNGGSSADWVIPVTDTKYFYSASGVNTYEVYRGGTKIATITVDSVQETSITATDANVAFETGYSSFLSSDEIWVQGTFSGDRQYRWANTQATSGAEIKQYDTFKLTGGDEDEILLFETIGDVLMIGNKNSLASWDDYVLTNFDFNIGCVSRKGYTKFLGTLYFIHYSGIYTTSGGVPKLISRKVDRYIRGATKSGLESAAVGYKGLSVFFSIGDVTLYHEDGSVFKTLTDVCLEYSVTDSNWYVHTNVPAEEFQHFIDASTGSEQLLINHGGTGKKVKEFLNGNDDDGEEIFMRIDTHPIQLMQEFETYATPISVITEVERGTALKCFVKTDGSKDFYELKGLVQKGASILKINHHDPTQNEPIITRKIAISIRDDTKQRPRITQMSLTYLPTGVDVSE